LQRRTSECKREGYTGGWKTLQNEKLHSFDVSLNIIKVSKPQRMRQDKCAEFWSEEIEGKRLLAKVKAYLEGQH